MQPTVATLTGSRGVANVEEVLGGNIFAADIIGASRDKLQKQLQDVVGKNYHKFRGCCTEYTRCWYNN